MLDHEQSRTEEGSMTREEFGQLWRKLYSTLFWTALTLLRDQEDAKDAVNDAFLSLFQNQRFKTLAEMQEKERVLYLTKSVRNHAVNTIRKYQAEKKKLLINQVTSESRNLFEERGIHFPGPFNRILLDWISLLPPKRRELLLFLLSSIETEQKKDWVNWAEDHGLRADDLTSRNNFYQTKARVRRGMQEIFASQPTKRKI